MLVTKKIMLVCLVMALVSASVYVFMANGIVLPESLESGESLPPYFYVIPAGYVVGGILILLRKRWLWITGAIINGFGILIFYATYADQVDVMLSPAGLITKAAQIVMEAGLIYLIVTYKRERLRVQSRSQG